MTQISVEQKQMLNRYYTTLDEKSSQELKKMSLEQQISIMMNIGNKSKDKEMGLILERNKAPQNTKLTEQQLAQKQQILDSLKINGKFENFKQDAGRDCWLLSTINALNSTPKGKEILKNAVNINSNKDVIVTLKGVNQQYTFTPNELKQASQEDPKTGRHKYSIGDGDVIAIELAVEQYRKETLKESNFLDKAVNWLNPKGKGVERPIASLNDDPLAAAHQYEGFYLLTKEKGETDIYNLLPDKFALPKSGKKYIDKPAQILSSMASYVLEKVGAARKDAKKMMNLEDSEDFIKKLANNPKRYTAICGFSKNGINDEEKDKQNFHWYSIESVKPDGKGGYSITVVNPWYGSKNEDKLITYTKNEFLSNMNAMTILDTEKIK